MRRSNASRISTSISAETMSIESHITEGVMVASPSNRLESLIADYSELRALYERVIREVDALATRGFGGPDGVERLRVWTSLVNTSRELIDRMHGIREVDVMIGAI